jgi:hypothetical protein
VPALEVRSSDVLSLIQEGRGERGVEGKAKLKQIEAQKNELGAIKG